MEPEIGENISEESSSGDRKADFVRNAIMFLVIVVSAGALYTFAKQAPSRLEQAQGRSGGGGNISSGNPPLYGSNQLVPGQENFPSPNSSDDAALEQKVLPAQGVVLPVKWASLGLQMIETGLIDAQKFEQVYSYRGGLSAADKKLIYGNDNGNIVISAQNSGALLNLLWAFGLGNKNEILEKGPMQDPRYGGAERFASTGGWTLAKDGAMEHYSRHTFVVLTPEQQQMVERVSKGIFRPCCNNPTYFPDCNHGMAMLGLLELMAAQGVSEDDMYKVSLQVNAYWFPDTYLTIAKYLEMKGIRWEDADPKGILGFDFSSASGFQQILSQVTPPDVRGGGGCGI